MGFRDDFVWGTATSSYQIEGAAYEDGKGLNIWDVFSKEDGKIYNAQSGDVACNHYYNYREDVKLMKELGIKAYRFSINWARVLPNGIGEVNEKGIDFYNRLIDELLANNIEPYITLYHWELPYELYKRGGWLNEEIVQWFGTYAALVAKRFSDRVKYYFTVNEPQCIVGLGYVNGIHAPGLKMGMKDTLQISHNLLKAHGQAVIELRKNAKGDIKIGYAPTGGMCYPESESKEDIEAARKALFSIPECGENWTWNTSWFSDPVFLGQYPEEGLSKFKEYLPKITKEDMKLISQPLDFMGQNIYNGGMVRMSEKKQPEFVKRPEGYARTANNWPITPKCLYWGVKFLYERYKLPIFITENGMSCHDTISLDGKVHDPNRIDFLNRYLLELRKALEEGIPIQGYFEWSLMDNFEWNFGYSERFGLVYINYETQERIIKDSGYWYKMVIESRGEVL
jgi:beta-galactosidase